MKMGRQSVAARVGSWKRRNRVDRTLAFDDALSSAHPPSGQDPTAAVMSPEA
jgi:hypothetical protein